MPRTIVSSWRLSLVLLLAAASCVFAAEPVVLTPAPAQNGKRPKRVYTTMRIQGQVPVIDGKLDDACWREQGQWSRGYEALMPHYGAKPTRETEIKIFYDNKNIYVAIRAFEDDLKEVARISGDRDEFVGDIVGVCFDSYHDLRSGFEFDLTAAGQKIDLRLFNTGWDTTFNAVWEGKTGVEANAWTAEFLIPLSQLRYSPGNTVWGLHSWRMLDRVKEESDWNLLANDDSGFAQSFGELHGLEGLKSNRRIELVPYASMKAETFGARNGEKLPETSKATFKGGLDAKVGLTSSITLDASILPDFGQVESDPSVMNLSTVETFLQERRTLFLEGQDIFRFSLLEDEVFYSRRIGQAPSLHPRGLVSSMPESTTLLGAVKVSGRTADGWSIGVLNSVTDRETVTVNRNGLIGSTPVEPQTNSFIARVQKDFRNGDTVVGGIVTRVDRQLSSDELRAAKPSSATVLGADLMHYWNDREYFLQVQAVQSEVLGDKRAISNLQLAPTRFFQRPIDGRSEYDPNLKSLTGSGLFIKGGKGSKGKWRYHEELLIKTPGLEFNDLGYLSVADQVKQQTYLAYIVKTPSTWYRSYSHEFSQNNAWTNHGEYLFSNLQLESYLELTNKWEFYTNLIYTGEGNDSSTLRGGPLMKAPPNFYSGLYMNTDTAKRVFAKAHWYESNSSNGSFHNRDIALELSYRPIPSLLLSTKVTSAHETDMLRQVSMTGADGSPGWFVSHLEGKSLSYTLRAQWIISPELSLKYYGNPFGSTVRQSDFRRVINPLASSYDARLGPTLASSFSNNSYSFDEDRNGSTDFTLRNPDGNYSSFRSNLVLKWEYRRGSMLYLVWSQQRDDGYALASDSTSNAIAHLQSIAPNNQFMAKMTYWFNM